MIEHIETVYEDSVPVSKEREQLFQRSLQMWLRPFSEEINKQHGRLVLIFCEDGSNRFRLEDVEASLIAKIEAQFPKFISR
jgi:hypothetical protein